MTLPAAPPIKASDINVELGRSAGAAFDIDGTEERSLAGVPSGAISMSNFLGKSSFSVSYKGTVSASLIGHTTVTIPAATFGPAAAGRRIFVALHAIGGSGSARTISSAVIGGVAAAVHCNISDHNTGTGATWSLAIISAVVPSGTTGDVVVTYIGSWSSGTVSAAVTSAIGLVGSSPTDTAVNFPPTGGLSASTTINVPASGVIIAAALQSQSGDITLTAPTPVTYDTTTYAGAVLSGQPANGSRALSAIGSGGVDPSVAVAGVTWQGH
jgi:hypothetical protein